MEEMPKPEAGWPQGHLDRQAATAGLGAGCVRGPPRGRVASTDPCRNVCRSASRTSCAVAFLIFFKSMDVFIQEVVTKR